jgi:VCBS repeat-containing protein
LAAQYGLTFGEDNFVYNKSTGFTAAIVTDENGVYTIVYRGTDAATSDVTKIAAAAANLINSNGDVDALDVQQDISLGSDTILTSSQAIDALNVVKMLMANSVELSNIRAVGQSLGGGLAGLVSAVYGVKATLLDPAPFAAHISALATQATLAIVREGGRPLQLNSTNYKDIFKEIAARPGDNTSLLNEFSSTYENFRNSYTLNVSSHSDTYLVRDELLTYSKTLDLLKLASAQHFPTPQKIYNAGSASDTGVALALHNPTLIALIARSEAEAGGRSFADLLNNNTFLREVFTGAESGIAGAKNHARSDLADTTSRVTTTGTEVGILERAFFKSIGSETDLYKLFYNLFDKVMRAGAVSETGDDHLPSIHDSVGKLVLGVMRDVVANTSTLKDIKDKIENIDLSFSGKNSTNFIPSETQGKIVVKLDDISATEKLYQGTDGLQFGVLDLNRFILSKLLEGSDQGTVEKVLDRSFTDIFGAKAKGLEWKVLLAQAGRDGDGLEYSASEAENKVGGLSHLIIGGSGDDRLGGSSSRDFILGGDGTNKLLGGRGDDVLVGGDGEDILDGGSGNSVYKGGAGADTFVIGAHMGRVDIMDVGAGDRLVLRLASNDGTPSTGYVLTGGLVEARPNESGLKVATFRSADRNWTYGLDKNHDIVIPIAFKDYYAPGTDDNNMFSVQYTFDPIKKLLEITVGQGGLNGEFRVRIPDFVEGMLGLKFETEYSSPYVGPTPPPDVGVVLANEYEAARFAQVRALLNAAKMVDLPDALDASSEVGSANRFMARFAVANDQGRDDTITIGARDDVLYGYGGNDTYVYSSSAPHDVRIEDKAYRSYDNSRDQLLLEGLTSADVSISRLDGGLDAVLTVKTTGATITLAREFGSSTVEAIEFADGFVLDFDGIKQATIDFALADGTATAVYGFDDRDDQFDAGAHAQELIGLGGSDTYRYTAAGGANIVVQDNYFETQSPNDKLVLVDLNPGDVTVSRDGDSQDAVLTVVASGRTITLAGQFANGTIETVVFANGITWTPDDIRQMLLRQASAGGGDTLYGFDGIDDTLVADRAHTKLVGYGGADTYVYAASTGVDVRIADHLGGGDDSAGDVLTFTDLDAGDVTLTQPDGGLDAVLTITSSGKTVTLEGQFGGGEIETIRFDDGTSWSAAQIRQMILAAPNAAPSGTVYGFGNGDDVLRAGSGVKTLVGYGGSDTYVYTAATDGNLTVSDRSYDPSSLETDLLKLTDVLESGVSVFRTESSGDAVLRILSTGKTIVLSDQFTYYPIERVEFSDGTTWSAAQIRGMVLAQSNAPGSGSAYGFDASDDTLVAGVRSKMLTGYSGGDTYVFEYGVHGNAIIADQGYDDSVDRLILRGVVPNSVSVSKLDGTGTLVLTLAPNGTTVTIEGQFGSTGVESIQFDDGTVWTADTIEELIYGPKNKAPMALPLALTGTEDTSLTVSTAQILGSASDPDGDPLALTGVQGFSNGTASLAADGSIVFTPDADFFGQAGFSYTVADGRGGATIGRVTLDLAAANDAPTASPALLRVREDMPAFGRVAGSDVDGDVLTFALKNGAGPGKGQVDLAADGTVLYTPTANLNGSDAFTVVVSDGHGGLTEVVVAVQITPRNDAPTNALESESAAVGQDGKAKGTLLPGIDVDGDSLTFHIVEGTSYGGMVELDPVTGTYVFTAEAGHAGPARFAYVLSDGVSESMIKFVEIVTQAGNTAPTVVPTMALQLDEDASVAGTVSATDPDGDALAYTVKSGAGPSKGTVAFGTGGAYTYSPTANANGSDAFTVVVSDGKGGIAEQAVSVSIAAVNDAPTAAASSSLQATEDTAVSGTIAASDVDGDALAYVLKNGAGPSKGTVAFGSGGAYTYTPTANANGSDAFTVVVSDGKGGIAEQAVSVSIAAVNDAPTAAASSSLQATEDTAVSGTIAASDVDGDALAYVLKNGAGPSKGTVAFGTGGAYTYSPTANANGSDAFTVVVSDGKGGLVEQTVSVSIAAVNDAPTAVADTGSAGENEAKTFDVLANDTDIDVGDTRTLASFTVRSVDGVPGGLSTASAQSAFSIQAGKLAFNPGVQFDPLASGQNATVVVDYVVQDAAGARSSASLTLTVTGADEPVAGGTSGADTLYGTSGSDTIRGLAGNDVIWGRDGNDLLYGDSDNDQLNGEGGNDLLDGGTGDDAMAGGAGDDTYYVDSTADTVTESAGAGTDEVRTTLSSYTLGANVENLAYIGTAAFTGTGNALANTLTGSAGNDKLTGGAGNDVYRGLGGNDFFYGGAGADSHDGGDGFDTVDYSAASAAIVIDLLVPTNSTGDAAGDTFAFIEQFGLSAYNDRFVGTGGIDYVYAQGGNDTLLGGGGDDWLAGGAGADSLDGQDGFDTADYTGASAAVVIDRATAANSTGDAKGDTFTSIERFQLSQFADRFVGSAESEYIYGNGGNDTLLGNDGNDWLIGGAGSDALTGGNGYDTASYFGAGAAVTIDRVTTSNSSGEAAGDTFTTIEAFQLTANFADRFVGSSAAENVYGGGGNDTLIGNAGNDFLDGEEQNDVLTGGAGSDTFAFYERGFGKDIVTDFTSGDFIEFSTSAFADFAAVKTHMTQVGANAVITLDADDTVTLQNVTAANLKATDFHFV